MTIAHGQTIELPTPYAVGWTRSVSVRLPFPLNTREQEYVEVPERADLDDYLRTDRRDESPVLETARKAFDAPALIVYAVRSDGIEPGSPETKYVAVSGRAADSSVMVVLDTERTVITAIAENELAASVASAVPVFVLPAFTAFESTVEVMSEIEDMCLSDASLRTKRAAMNAAGLPPDFVAMREAMVSEPRTAVGLVSAVSLPVADEARPASRAALWVESPSASYLQSSLAPRGSRIPVVISPVNADQVFRAATNAIASCYEPSNAATAAG